MNKKIKNILWLSGDKYLSIFFSFLLTIVISKSLDLDVLGKIIYAQSLISLFVYITLSALDSVFIREFSKGVIKNIKECVFFIKIVGALISYLLSISVLSLNENGLSIIQLAILSLPLLFSFASYVDIQSIYRKDIYIISMARIILTFVLGCLKLYLVSMTENITIIVALLIFDQIIIYINMLYQGFNRKYFSFDFSISFSSLISGVKYFLIDGYQLIISSFLLAMFTRTNIILVEYFCGTEQLTFYSIPMKIMDGFSVSILSYVTAVYPYLVDDLKIKKQSHVANEYFSKIVLFSFAISIMMFVFSDFLIIEFFGDKFLPAITVLKINSISIVFYFIFIATGRWFVAVQKTNIASKRNLLSFIINLILSLVLIPIFGVDGAAVSALISWMISGLFILFFDKENQWLFISIIKSPFIKYIKVI